MNARSAVRILSLAGILTLSVASALGALLLPHWRQAYLYAPKQQAVEDAIRAIVAREMSLFETAGAFSPFSGADIQRNGVLLALSWQDFPVGDFYFDAALTDTGTLKLRALPKSDSVASLAVRGRFYTVELSPNGEALRAGWYPADPE